MSMFKNPLNLNIYLILMIEDKLATILKIEATEDLNYSFSSYISLCKWTYIYKNSHSSLVFIIDHDIFGKYKAITSAFNVQNALYVEPSDENNDCGCIYFCMNLISICQLIILNDYLFYLFIFFCN